MDDNALSSIFFSSSRGRQLHFIALLKPTLLFLRLLSYHCFAYVYIREGMTSPLSGSLQTLEKQIQLHINICFNRINFNSDVHEQRISLLIENNKYQYHLALANISKLIDEHDVIAVNGNKA